LSDGHTFDLIDIEAVGLDVDLGLQLQPGLLQRGVAVAGTRKVTLKLVDILNQVLSFTVKLQGDSVYSFKRLDHA